MYKKWKIREKYSEDFENKFPELNLVVLQLLWNRGLDDQDQIDMFLGPDYHRDLHDPFLYNDMHKAVKLIRQMIKEKKKILIYGDYDADGVTSTAVLYLTLKKLGVKDLSVYIPNRLIDGYGMNKKAVTEIIKDKVDLIITCDCGISNVKEIAQARAAGIKVIVTDHHLPSKKLPKAEAIICATVPGEKYPFKKLAGVGVAFKVAQALLSIDEANQAFEKWLLDIVAIGTVADMVPLFGENRVLVKWGLLVLNKTQRLGLQELISSISVKGDLDTYNIGFQIAPRLNAAGRMDHANTAYELLITSDEVEALAIANDLNEKNKQRQKVTEEMMKISLEQIGEPEMQNKILFSHYDEWSPGLVGLAAGRLNNKFHRPVIVFGKNATPQTSQVGGQGDRYVGSGRSIEEFDITQALMECQEYLEEFGGHTQACGLTIVGEDNFNKFKDKISQLALKRLADVELVPSLDIEAEIKLSQANWELIDALDKFAPFGEGNSQPFFMTRNLEICDMITMGTSKQHLRLDLKDKSVTKCKKFVGFGLVEKWINKIKIGDKIDVVYRLSVNEWNGNREIEFMIEDIKNQQDQQD